MGFTEDGPESGYHQYTSPLPPNHLIYLHPHHPYSIYPTNKARNKRPHSPLVLD